MTPSDPTTFDAQGHARSAASLLGLSLHADHLPGVAANLRLALRMAALVASRPLPPAAEPAPVFVAGRDTQ